ncbi:hypothetical protein [Paenibacillus sp. MMO-58]|uniref:hypothetical protein n=1 Tax=Paenibacillus sp. MMO-58 TaxID=3081290 RepID=UPI003018402F
MKYQPLKQEEPAKAEGLNAGFVIYDECVFERNGTRMNSLKEQFVSAIADDFIAHNATHLIVAVQLPNGAVEIIHNTSQIPAKANYYIEQYDEEFRLKVNPAVRIINFMIV